MTDKMVHLGEPNKLPDGDFGDTFRALFGAVRHIVDAVNRTVDFRLDEAAIKNICAEADKFQRLAHKMSELCKDTASLEEFLQIRMPTPSDFDPDLGDADLAAQIVDAFMVGYAKRRDAYRLLFGHVKGTPIFQAKQDDFPNEREYMIALFLAGYCFAINARSGDFEDKIIFGTLDQIRAVARNARGSHR